MKAAKTATILDSRRAKIDGSYPVKLRVTFERKQRYFPTPHDLNEKDFDRVMFSKRLNETEKILKNKITSFETKAIQIIESMPVFTWKAFEKHYLTNRATKGTIKQAFEDNAKELREAGRIGTAYTYECAQRSLDNFAPDAKFQDITPDFLRKYEKWMLDRGNSITTVGIYLRSLRALFNNAIEAGSLTKEYYPFGKKRYEIPTANNIKKSLSLSEIALLYNYQPEPGTMAAISKDYWMFMYLCNGINMKDVCLLKYENIKGDVLEFVRAKTARTKRKVVPIRIVITDDVRRIISTYGNKDVNPGNYIFPVLHNGVSPERERQLVQQLTHVINSHMNNIASKLGIKSKITTYVARHSFSSILQRSGVSTEFISEALGHSNLKTTQHYLAGFEDEKKIEAVRALTAFKTKLKAV
jgi:integrase/recombinase XerD